MPNILPLRINKNWIALPYVSDSSMVAALSNLPATTPQMNNTWMF